MDKCPGGDEVEQKANDSGDRQTTEKFLEVLFLGSFIVLAIGMMVAWVGLLTWAASKALGSA